MLRPISFLSLMLLLWGCSSGPDDQDIAETPENSALIGLSEVAEKTGGRYRYVPARTKGIIDAANGEQLVAHVGLDRVLLGGVEYKLSEPISVTKSEVFIPRQFFEVYLKEKLVARKAVVLPPRPIFPLPRKVERSPVKPIQSPRPLAKARRALEGWVICVDAGHGGKDPGAMVGGAREKDINLRVSRELASRLRAAGARVVMTRQNDTFIGLDRRVEIGGRCDLFVSIHANSIPHRGINGIEVYVKTTPNGSGVVSESWKLARSVLSSSVSRTGAKSRGTRQNIRSLRVLRKSRIPAILVETGYLTNAAERGRLVTASYQRRIAAGVLAGVERYARTKGTPYRAE